MTSTDEIDDVNKKLIQQILKLRQAKAEMQETFDDLDNLLHDTSSYTKHYSPHHRLPKTNKYLIEDDVSIISASSTDDDYAIKIKYDSSLLDDATSDLLESSSFNGSSSSETTIVVTRPPPPRRKKTPPPPARSPANIKFSYKMPLNYSPTPSYNPANFQPADYRFYESLTGSASGSDWSSDARKPPKSTTSKSKPFQPPYKSGFSSSMSSLSDYKESRKPVKSNPAFNVPWKHTGKTKPTPVFYMSSQDLTRSVDRGSFSREKKRAAKDIGPGWKPALSRSKTDLTSSASSSNSRLWDDYKERNRIKKVTVKRKIIIDDKDIGGGWKTTLGKPKSDLGVYTQIPIDDDYSDMKKSKKRTTVVKRKVIMDEKDVGKGWKPVAVRQKDDIKIYEGPPIGSTTSSSVPPPKVAVAMKKKVEDEKDVGDGWKPVGRIKPESFPKSSTGDVKKSSDSDAATASKPPLPKDSTKSTKPKWIPPGSKIKTINKSDEAKKTTAAEPPPDKKPPSSSSAAKPRTLVTSTPNMSKNFDDENPLEESIIEKEADENKKLPNDKPKEEPKKEEPNKDNDDLNKTMRDDEEEEIKDEEIKEEPKKDEPKKEEPKKEEPKKEEPKKEEPKKEEPKKEEPKKDEPDDEEEVKDDEAANEEPKDFVFRKFFGGDEQKKDDENADEAGKSSPKEDKAKSKSSDNDSENIPSASGGNTSTGRKSNSDSVFQVVDDEDEAEGDKEEKSNAESKNEGNKEKKNDDFEKFWNQRDSDDE